MIGKLMIYSIIVTKPVNFKISCFQNVVGDTFFLIGSDVTREIC